MRAKRNREKNHFDQKNIGQLCKVFTAGLLQNPETLAAGP
jgi:hypothetical protein